MNRMNRRRFVALSSAGVASAVLVACGNESASKDDLNPTMIPDVAGAPPTLAPMASPPSTGGSSGGQASGGQQAAGGEQASGGGATSVDVEAGDLYFKPTEFEISPGGTIKLTNAGALQHDMFADGWTTEELIPLLNGGDSGEFTVPDDAEVGTKVTFYCSVPGHREAGMEGTFTIVEAGAGGAAEEASPEQATASGEQAAGGASEVAVEAGDLYFDPTEFEIAPGGKITLNNAGALQHDMYAEDWVTDELVPLLNGGESGEFTVPEDAEVGAKVTFYCSVPGHREAGMQGTFTIVEAGGGGASASPSGEASPAATPEAASGGASAGDSKEVAVEAGDLYFDPTEFEIAAGGTIKLTNAGMLQHDMYAQDWDVEELIPLLNGGEEGEFTVPEDAKKGTKVTFYCSVPGHKEAGMQGTFTIV